MVTGPLCLPPPPPSPFPSSLSLSLPPSLTHAVRSLVHSDSSLTLFGRLPSPVHPPLFPCLPQPLSGQGEEEEGGENHLGKSPRPEEDDQPGRPRRLTPPRRAPSARASPSSSPTPPVPPPPLPLPLPSLLVIHWQKPRWRLPRPHSRRRRRSRPTPGRRPVGRT